MTFEDYVRQVVEHAPPLEASEVADLAAVIHGEEREESAA